MKTQFSYITLLLLRSPLEVRWTSPFVRIERLKLVVIL